MLTLLPALVLAPLLSDAPAQAPPAASAPPKGASAPAPAAASPPLHAPPTPDQAAANPLHGAAAPKQPAWRPLHCEVTDVSSKQARHARGRFRATRVVDLRIGARLLGRARGERMLRLRVHAPGGFLYQVFELPLDASHGRRRRFEARLPVAGSSIMANGLYGRFEVVPYLDDQPRPCGRPLGFTIQP